MNSRTACLLIILNSTFLYLTVITAQQWPKTFNEAKQCQMALRDQVITQNQFHKVNRVAGVDVGFEDNGKIMRAAVVVLSFPELVMVEKSIIQTQTTFPYIPGYLSFREAPADTGAHPSCGWPPAGHGSPRRS